MGRPWVLDAVPELWLKQAGTPVETLVMWMGNSSLSLETLGPVPASKESCPCFSRLTQPHSPQAGGVEAAEALSHAESPWGNGDGDKGRQTFPC